jgi:hypothetical protein
MTVTTNLLDYSLARTVIVIPRHASGDVPRAAELYRASISVLPLADSLADAHTGLALALRSQCM